MFSIRVNWEDPSGVAGEELSATWCSMTITVNDLVVTEVLRTRSKTVDDKIFVPAYVLAEWFVINWFVLLAEIETPRRSVNNAYIKRHSLMFSKNGYEFPNLYIYPVGNEIRVECSAIYPNNYGLRYLTTGDEVIEMSAFRNEIYHFIDTVVARLDDLSIYGTLLQSEWAYISTIESEELKFCWAVGALGGCPFALSHEDSAELIDAYELGGDILVKELTAISESIPELSNLVIWASQFRNDERFEYQIDLSKLDRDLLKRNILDSDLPFTSIGWARGYAAARQVRAQIGFEPSNGISNIQTFLSIFSGRRNGYKFAKNVNTEMSGLVYSRSPESHLVDIALSNRRESSALFDLSRALGIYLIAPTSAIIPLTSSYSYLQQVSRAFAAEFLAPAQAIEEQIRNLSYLDESDYDDIADRFGVSPWVIRHQVDNHRIQITH